MRVSRVRYGARVAGSAGSSYSKAGKPPARAKLATTAHHDLRQASRRILEAQKVLGNFAVRRQLSVQIQRLTADEKARDLSSPRFSGNQRLQRAFDNEPAMRSGETGEAVATLQSALIDDGAALPISTKKTGSPDGIFGAETTDAVKQFQRKYSLLEKGVADGIVGRHTLEKLDELNLGPAPKKTPEIEADEKEMGAHVVKDMDRANQDPKTADSGIHYSYNYEASFPDKWQESYRLGFADPTCFDHLGFMDWRLKPGVSASAAIKAWLKGLTIAECLTTVIAIQFDTFRAAVGDDKFDQTFGSAGKAHSAAQRMRIFPGNETERSQIFQFMKPTDAAAANDAGTFGNRPVKEGEWYYFYNHPKYLLKHPGGAWQGENAIYMGRDPLSRDQLWSGLGTLNQATGQTRITEQEMFEEMIADYNRERDDNDRRALDAIRAGNGGKMPEKYLLPEEGGSEFENTVDQQKILNDPEYELNGTKRKGGFLVSVGTVLDPAKVRAVRDAP